MLIAHRAVSANLENSIVDGPAIILAFLHAETKNVDIGDAHISVEIDGGKASGSMG